jgi:hypothetical protein
MPTSRQFLSSGRFRTVRRSLAVLATFVAVSLGAGRLLAQTTSDDSAHWTWQRRGAAGQTSENAATETDGGDAPVSNRRLVRSETPDDSPRPARRRSLFPLHMASLQPSVSVLAPKNSPSQDAGELPPPENQRSGVGVPPLGGGAGRPVGPPVGRPAKAGTPTETGEYFDYDSQIYHEGGYPSGNGGPLGWDPFGSPDCSCGCDGCDCGYDSRFEIRGEYLLWWGKGDHLPPLVTTSPVGTPRSTAGVLGAPTTTIRFGDTDANDQARSGGRVTLDAWLTCNQGLGIEANYFILGDRKTNFADSSDPIIARPFFDVQTQRQAAQLVAFPGVATGSITVSAKSELQGAELLLRGNLFEQCCNRLDFLIGYRYLRLAEALTIDAESTTISIDDGSNDPTLDVSARFRTVNNFNGADLGLLAEWRNCRWSVDFLMKLALGSTNSRVTIGGSTVIASGQTTTAPGGLLAARSNMGTFDRDAFAVVPELGLTLGYDVTCQLRVTAGYTFLYWSQVARPADQIDLNVNPNGGAFPQFNFHCADFWAQGLTLGLDYRF